MIQIKLLKNIKRPFISLELSNVIAKTFFLSAFISCLLIQNIFAQAPTITNFTPSSGTIGTTVTITGTNFNATPDNNIVVFNTTRATVITATTTQLTVIVPTGATHGYISILNTSTGLLTYSTKKFIPTFTPNNTTITAADFIPSGNFTTGLYPISLALGDIDGDGKTDMVTVNNDGGSPQNEHSVSVLRNTSTVGAISFAPKLDLTADSYARSVALGDLDGDGKLDIAVVNSITNTVSVFRNTSTVGSIDFAPKMDFATASGEYGQSIAIDDFDADGKSDLAVATNGITISLLRNISTIGTIDFAPKVDFSIGGNHDSIALGDLDNDGLQDIVVTNYFGNSVSVLRNNSTLENFNFVSGGTFSATQQAKDVSIGDLDNDGKLDLVVASFATTGLAVLRNSSSAEGNIGFDTTVNIATNANSYTVTLGDLNGDSKLDIATEHTGFGDLLVYQNTSTSGNFSHAPKVTIDAPVIMVEIAIADLDGDGIPELMGLYPNYNLVGIFRNSPVGLSIPDVDVSSNITVYPNPANSSIIIKNSKNYTITNVDIIDVSGRVIQSIDSDFENEFNLDVSHLSAGNYFLKLQSENGIAIKKFIKN